MTIPRFIATQAAPVHVEPTERERARTAALHFQLRHVVARIDIIWDDSEQLHDGTARALEALRANPDLSGRDLHARFGVSKEAIRELRTRAREES